MGCWIFIRGGGRGVGGDEHDCQPLPSCAAANNLYRIVRSFFCSTASAGRQAGRQAAQQTEHIWLLKTEQLSITDFCRGGDLFTCSVNVTLFVGKT
jgi:hypothetical protein